MQKIKKSSEDLTERMLASEAEGVLNLIRISKRKTSANQYEHRKSMEIIFLVANPLVKIDNITKNIEPLFGTQTNL